MNNQSIYNFVSPFSYNINRHIALSISALFLCTYLTSSNCSAASIVQTFKDTYSFDLQNGVGITTTFKFQVDTQLVVSKDKLRAGESATFDYTQSYLMTTDPEFLGQTRGVPEMIPANAFGGGSTFGFTLIPKHFEHDLFLSGCAEFTGLTNAAIFTANPGSPITLTIGPFSVGGSGTDLSGLFTAHQTSDKTWIDWVTTAPGLVDNNPGGFFFNGGKINLQGTLIGIAGGDAAVLSTSNEMLLSAHGSVFPTVIVAEANTRFGKEYLYQAVLIECEHVPDAGPGILTCFLVLTGLLRAAKKMRG